MSEQIIRPLNLGDGFFYVVEFSATGGVRYARQSGHEDHDRETDRLRAEFVTTKEVDHVGLLKESKAIINAAYNAMERHATHTPIGYWVAREHVVELHEMMAVIRGHAAKFNEKAQTARSGRRVRIDLYAVQATVDEYSVASRLAETVRERLTELGQALRAGDLTAFSSAWKRAKNLPRLATGIQAESIVLGLEGARLARDEYRELIKAGKTPEQAGAAVDLDALESAIVLFTDSVNGALYETPELEDAA